MNEYEPRVLRKLQLLEVEILQDLDALCKKHEIPYVAFYGTAIGAVRHKGFIPWDDDVDVLMLRDDYERFLEIAKTECTDKYEILNAEIDEKYPCCFSKWGLKGTWFVGKDVKRLPCKFRIAVDILPLDAVSDDDKARKKQMREAWFWQKLMMLRQISKPVLSVRGVKRVVIYAACGVIHFGLKLLHISPKWLYKKYKAASLRYHGEKTKEVARLAGTHPGDNIYLLDGLFPTQYLEFEGIMLPFPQKNDEMLTRCYGDYMQLPPEDERVNHFPYLLDFGDGERYQSEA